MRNMQDVKKELYKSIQKRNFQEALEYYHMAVNHQSEDPSLRLVGADIYLSMGMKQLAIGELRKAFELYLGSGKKTQALACAEKIKGLSPDDLDILETLAKLYKELNNEEKAASYYGEYIARLVKMGKINDARKIIQRVKNDGLEKYIQGKYQFLLSDTQVQSLLGEISKESNYAAFFALMRKEIARSERYQREFSIILIEMDKVLIQDKKAQLLEIFKRVLRESDMYSIGYRWLFIILPETNRYGLEAVLNRMMEKMDTLFGSKKFYVASYPEDGKDVKELIVSALRYRVFL
ncbi:MAG TPA: hypothetical protein PKU94_02465 [Candidatus Hydrothermia bacterium]|nr:hypothetical protein [Candidatus Hydrothermae bacterium]MDD3649842.1 hypothetical protein [Candidatus Hydrothermia bacterium]HOK22786.1 hypothetical protein [Candidatus Hydrothermia bacterium]HOL23495.1 hypothetical protein [Candidatus Hydrothermia bacterium]HOP32228.1 hypothetical protein [Candidatus Hydrothermia bacterium]